MPRHPITLLAWGVAGAAIVTGGLMMVGMIAPHVEPTMRFAFGGVLVLYGLFRIVAQTARDRGTEDD